MKVLVNLLAYYQIPANISHTIEKFWNGNLVLKWLFKVQFSAIFVFSDSLLETNKTKALFYSHSSVSFSIPTRLSLTTLGFFSITEPALNTLSFRSLSAFLYLCITFDNYEVKCREFLRFRM